MLQVRAEQSDILDRSQAERFLDRAVAFVRTSFPETADGLGEKETRLAVEDGIAHAEEHGIISEEGILHFVSVRFTLGPDFDKDPEYPWAKEILTDPRITDPEDRAMLLFETTREFVDEAAAIEDPHGR